MAEKSSNDRGAMFELASKMMARILQTKFFDKKLYVSKVVISKEKPTNGDAGVYLEQIGDDVWLGCNGWVLACISTSGIYMSGGVGEIPIKTENGKVAVN